MTALIENSYLGLVDFNKALNLQNDLWHLAQNKNQISIIGLQHPTVITLGKRADFMNTTDWPVHKINRGGLATIHSEGQLVIYPILNLRENKIGIKDFVCFLLKVTQETFLFFGVKTYIDDQQIGLYTEAGKIAFCGLEIKEGVSQHGLSINLANDLGLFDQITSCGIQNLKTDKLAHHRSDVCLSDFFEVWVKLFKEKMALY